MFCPACGTKAEENGTFCTHCGAPLSQRPARPAPPAAVPPSAAPRLTVRKGSNTTLVVVLVIVGGLMLLGIVSAVAIPSLLGARQKACVKTTRQDISTVTTALMDYLVDNGTLPAQSGRYDTGSEFAGKLSPFYVKVLPAKDAWSNDLLVYCGEACNGHYGLSNCQADEILVVSLGKDRSAENWEYDPSNPGAGFYQGSSFSDYDRDLVMYNGNWIRAPFN